MARYKTIEIWNMLFGNVQDVYDYTGRLMKKSACGNPRSRYCPTIDHIRPISQGGSDTLDNIVLCHRDTNIEKANKFPHWRSNGKKFYAVKSRGSRGGYDIIYDNLPNWLK